MISQLQEDVVQGPFDDPELGQTIRVTPTLETARAGRFASQAVVVTSAARMLIRMSKEGEKVHAVVVQGEDHDPTKHPDFDEISRNLRELLNKHFPKAKLLLVSDEPTLERSRVRHALMHYDQPVLRLDAGFQKTFTALTGQPGAVFKERVERMAQLELERLVIRASFVRGKVDNSQDKEVKAWLKHVASAKPAAIWIDSPKKPAVPACKPITATRMKQIAELVGETVGVPVEVR